MSTICHKMSIICHKLSTICHKQSTICHKIVYQIYMIFLSEFNMHPTSRTKLHLGSYVVIPQKSNATHFEALDLTKLATFVLST